MRCFGGVRHEDQRQERERDHIAPWAGSTSCVRTVTLSRYPRVTANRPRVRQWRHPPARRTLRVAGMRCAKALRLSSRRRSVMLCAYLSPGARWVRAYRTTSIPQRLARLTSGPGRSKQDGGSMRSAAGLPPMPAERALVLDHPSDRAVGPAQGGHRGRRDDHSRRGRCHRRRSARGRKRRGPGRRTAACPFAGSGTAPGIAWRLRPCGLNAASSGRAIGSSPESRQHRKRGWLAAQPATGCRLLWRWRPW